MRNSLVMILVMLVLAFSAGCTLSCLGVQGEEHFKQDSHRPTYHLLPLANWMNDPNGLIYWKGEYHLFYQHNPNGAFWGNMHWGHAVSPDLIHWKHLPIALAPTPDGPDKDGVFSGCALNNQGVPTLVYTGTQPEVQCLAVGDSQTLNWKKHPSNPVIGGPPPGLKVTGFRDPWVWKEGESWLMALGSGGKVQPDLHLFGLGR